MKRAHAGPDPMLPSPGRRAGRRAGPRAPVKGRPALLHAGMSVKEAFHAVMLAGLAHLQANEPGLLRGRDSEYLHQVRVALRRMRSAIEIFEPLLPMPAVARAVNGVKWIAASLEAARDWDVFVGETLPAFERHHRARRGFAEYSARCEQLRGRAHVRAQRAIRSLRYRRAKRLLADLIESGDRPARLDDTAARAVLLGPVGDFASAILERRHGQVLKRGRRIGGQSARDLHRLRIAVKKCRYAADFFSSLYDAKPARRVLKRLARLQDILGAMNDAAMVAELTAHGFEGARGQRTLETRDALLRWSRGRPAALKHGLKGAWKHFRAARKYW